MKTRTLLLLAVTCGIAILIAGTVQLLRVADQKNSTVEVRAGQVGKAGDASVVLDQPAAVQPGTVTVTVTLGGVDDAGGLDGFRLLAPNATRPVTGGTCTGFTEAPVQCTLTFDNSGLSGSTRALLFDRAGDRLRWALTA